MSAETIRRNAIIAQKNKLKGGSHLKNEANYSSVRSQSLHLQPISIENVHLKRKGTIVYDDASSSVAVYNGKTWDNLILTSRNIPHDREIRTQMPVVDTSIVDTPIVYEPDKKDDVDGWSKFSDESFKLFNNDQPTSIVKFDAPNRPNTTTTITIPRSECILPAIDKRNNTLLGDSVYSLGVSESQGRDNTFIGTSSGSSTTSGDYNCSLGSMSLSSNLSGSRNVAIGYKSLYTMSFSDSNTAIGYQSLKNVEGNCNVSVGCVSQINTTKGECNTSIGTSSLATNEVGSRNICIGHKSGLNLTGNDNIVIGCKADVKPSHEGCIVIGNGGKSTESGQLVIHGGMSGLVQLSNGTGVVLTKSVTSSSRILLTIQEPQGTIGMCYIGGRIPGTGFTISSTSSKDSSIVGWFMFEA